MTARPAGVAVARGAGDDTGGAGAGAGPPAAAGRVPRRAIAAVGLGLVAACLAQAPGRLVADTKLDLAVNPAGLMSRALHAWDPVSGFGSLQNQTQGYLFPVGPFFAAAHGVGIPMSVTQRLWIGLLLAVAAAGTIRLADELELGTPATRVVAGLAYALSPALLILIGPLSSLVLPAALAPWAVTPLVRGSRSGSPVSAAARSGVAVALMGAVNSGTTVAVLVLPALWLLTRQPSARRRSLMRWWVVAISLACAWWALSGAVELRYGFGFLSYIERARATTSTASATETLRGSANWIAHYFAQGRPWWPGGWLLVATPAAILASAALAAGGLAGLASGALAERGWLILAVLAGLVLTAAAYQGPLGGPLAITIQHLLDGPLQVFRSINKFQPVVTLPLALGLAHGVARGLAALRPAGPERPLMVAIVGLLLAGTALPVLRGQLLPAGSFARIPAYWSDTAHWLAAHAGGNRSLLLPASGFGQYQWGRPMDEPLQALAGSPWAVRDQAPLGTPGLTRLLDAIDGRIVAARPTPGLAPVLARAGVQFVVARNDLDWRRVGAPDPTRVRAFLAAAPGLHRVAMFGPLELPVAVGAAPADPPVHAVEVYQVDDAVARAATYPAMGATVVSGGPEALLQLADRGQLSGATVLAGDPTAALGSDLRTAVTDGMARRNYDFGLVDGGYSYVLAAGETPAGGTGPPQDRLPVPGAGHQTVAVMEGAAAVTASSYATAVAPHPESQPMAAFDGDPATAWESGAAGYSNGQWVELTLDHAISFPYVTVQLFQPGAGSARPTSLALSTDTGTVVVAVAAGEAPQRLALPLGATQRLRVTLVGVVGEDPAHSLARTGLREVTLPGLTVRRPLAVPNDQAARLSQPATPTPIFAFDRLVADPAQGVRGDEEDRLDRRFVVPQAGLFEVSGTFRARAGADLDALLTTVAPGWPSADAATTISLPCGSGPEVGLDGLSIPTSATVALGELRAGAELPWSACGSALSLAPGSHELVTAPQASLGVLSATVAGPTWQSILPPAPARPVAVTTWGANHRVVRVGTGEASVLALSENFSVGWSAHLNHHLLPAIRIDGWRQAWVVPAGAGGTVTLDFTPDRWFRLALAVGALALVALAGLATGLVGRRGAALDEVAARDVRVLAGPAGTAALLLVGGPAALIAPVALVALRRPAPPEPEGDGSGRRRVTPAVVAGGAFLLAGLIEATHPARVPASHAGAFSWAAQLAALVSVGAVTSVLLPSVRRRRAGAHFAGAGAHDEDGGQRRPAGEKSVEGAGQPGDVVVRGPGQGDVVETVGPEVLDQGSGGEQPQVADDHVAGPAEDAEPADLGEHRLDAGQQEEAVEPGGQVRGREDEAASRAQDPAGLVEGEIGVDQVLDDLAHQDDVEGTGPKR